MNKILIILSTFLLFLSSVSLGGDPADFRKRAFQLNQATYDESDVKAEIDFGRALAARILSKYKLVNDQQLQHYLSSLGSGVAAMIGRPELKFYFAVLDTEDVNAYACPGGYIFITKGTFKQMKTEAELVGVIAHEIGHVNGRHVLKKLKIKGEDSSLAAGLGALVGGSTASFRLALQTLMDSAVELLFEKGVMKSEELQSDTMAIRALMSLKYSIGAYRKLIASLEDTIKSGNGRVLSKTHPSTAERLKNIDLFITQNNLNKNTAQKINSDRYKRYASF